MSSYMYTAGNPVMLVDPDGMEWKSAKDKEQANKMDANAKNRIKKNNEKITSLQKSNGNEDAIKSLQAQNNELQNSINERSKMGSENDPTLYTFKQINKAGGKTYRKKNIFGKTIIVMEYGDEAEAFHEQLHAYKRGQELLDPNAKYASGYCASEEAAAKRREYSALPVEKRNTRGSLFQHGYFHITTNNWVERIRQLSNDPKYPYFKEKHSQYIQIANDWLKEQEKPLIR